MFCYIYNKVFILLFGKTYVQINRKYLIFFILQISHYLYVPSDEKRYNAPIIAERKKYTIIYLSGIAAYLLFYEKVA